MYRMRGRDGASHHSTPGPTGGGYPRSGVHRRDARREAWLRCHGWRRGLAGQHTDTPTDWRPPRGLRGLAGLRADAPSEARGADSERAGRPRGGRRSVGATSSNSQRGRHAGGPPPTAQHGPQDRTRGARNTSGATSKARNTGPHTAGARSAAAPRAPRVSVAHRLSWM